MRIDVVYLRSTARLLELKVKVLTVAAASNRTYAARFASLKEIAPHCREPITAEEVLLAGVRKALLKGRTPKEAIARVGDYIATSL